MTSFKAVLTLLTLGYTSSAESVLSVHGSGTSNPNRCFGTIMEEMQGRSKHPIRLTYRSVGSSTGITEFINDFDMTKSAADFGSTEIPLTTEEWQTFKDANVTVLQVPALFGAVSFFHSVPDMPNLNLTACLLARIFTRDIKDWAHPDIREINPQLSQMFEAKANSDSLGASLRIRVARRDEGASNTFSATSYLHTACPQHYPEEMVGTFPDWPIDTEACRGTVGMNQCIEERIGTIGYNEIGIAHAADLQEISIKNKYGRLLNSKLAAANNGIGAKEAGVLPSEPTDDFGGIDLLDQDGEWTWPITLLTYLTVRADLSFKSPEEAALVVAFVRALYDPDYVAICTKFGFILPEGASLKLAQKGIEILESALPQTAPKWEFESKVDPVGGMGEYVLSSNRRNFPAFERTATLEHVEALEATIDILEAKMEALTLMLNATDDVDDDESIEFTESNEAMILAGLIISTLALAIGLALVMMQLFVKRTTASPVADDDK